MSDTYIHAESSLSIDRLDGSEKVCIVTPRHHAHIPNDDVPTVTAELLKAAGHHYLADYIEEFQARVAVEKQALAEKKLQERRDAVLAALLPEAAAANNLPEPHELSTLCDRALDYIIELQDKAATP